MATVLEKKILNYDMFQYYTFQPSYEHVTVLSICKLQVVNAVSRPASDSS